MSSETKIDEGGPAFPQVFQDLGNGQAIYPEQGMTLRDYFAAKVIQAVIWPWYEGSGKHGYANAAEHAYQVADAMLQARKGANQ